jgi:hypothetical protein
MDFKRYCASIKLSDYGYLIDYPPDMIRDIEFRNAIAEYENGVFSGYIADYYPMPKDDGYLTIFQLKNLRFFYRLFMIGDISWVKSEVLNGISEKDGIKNNKKIAMLKKQSILWIVQNTPIDSWPDYVYSWRCGKPQDRWIQSRPAFKTFGYAAQCTSNN